MKKLVKKIFIMGFIASTINISFAGIVYMTDGKSRCHSADTFIFEGIKKRYGPCSEKKIKNGAIELSCPRTAYRMFYVKVNQEDLKQNNDIALYGKQQKCE